MIKQSDIELFNRVIDGLANADEQEEVRALLDRDSSARQYFDSLVLASTHLAKSERAIPPASLKTNVMAELATLKAPAVGKANHSLEFFSYLRNQWQRSTSFNLSIGTLAGAAAVVLVVSLFNSSGNLSKDSLRGTIGSGTNSKSTILTSGTVSAGRSHLQFDLNRSGKTLNANILASPADVAQVTITYDPSDLKVVSVTAQGAPITPQAGDGKIQFTATPGTAYQVTFEDVSAVVSNLTFDITDDHLTARQEISTGSGTSAE